MGQLVVFNRKWEINTKEDYDKVMSVLDDNEFMAEMSDDFSVWQREKAEIANQRFAVRKQAIDKGIIDEEVF